MGLENIENSQSKINRISEKTPWEEVRREKDILIVGDSHGNYKGFKANMTYLGALNENRDWSAENRIVILLGDILADRHSQGLEIISHTSKLKKQARACGGDIVTIAGNHDDWALSYLLGINVAAYPKELEDKNLVKDPLTLCCLNRQGMGLFEFSKFLDEDGSSETEKQSEIFKLFLALYNQNEKILKKIRQTAPELLQELCDFRLCEQIDDTLFLHTPPTDDIVQFLLNNNIDEINSCFQKVLNFYLLGEGTQPTPLEYRFFEVYRRVFLYTCNRTTFENPDLSDKLKNKGINHIIHGHMRTTNPISVSRAGMEITNIDLGAFFYDKTSDHQRSTGIIKASNGEITVGVNKICIRAGKETETSETIKESFQKQEEIDTLLRVYLNKT